MRHIWHPTRLDVTCHVPASVKLSLPRPSRGAMGATLPAAPDVEEHSVHSR